VHCRSAEDALLANGNGRARESNPLDAGNLSG
jgi:hypothetical protein